MTAPTVRHRDVGDKYATGVPKIKEIRGRENIAVGTWNEKTLRPAGKLEQLTHTMRRYHWNIVGLCEMRWKNFGEMSTDDGHKVYFSGEEGKHEYGVGFLVHKDAVDKECERQINGEQMMRKTFAFRKTLVALLFYIHGKHLRSCRDGQLT